MFCHQKIIIFCIVWFFINFSSYTDSENVNIQFDVRRIIREYNGNVTSALHRALCPEPDFELIKALIREGADVNHLNKKWEITPLGTAARCDVHGTGQDLDKTNLSIEDKKAEASRRTIESLRILIEAGADVNISNGIALRNVASSSLNSEVIDFLVENGADINVKNGVGATALFEARNPDLIRALIRFGIDFNVRNKYHDCTALMNILWMGANLETLEAHLETGIDVNAKSKDGLTALIAAIRYNEPSVIRRLIEAGANVNDISTSGYTILMSVLFNAQTVTLEVVQMLLDAGAQADINLQSQYNGQTALMISLSNVHNQDTAIISALMKAGAELNNLTDKKGRTALLIAAENTGNPDILSLLINAGADLKAVDKDGHDFEYYALKNKNPEILETALRILGKEPNSNTIAMRQKNDDEINVKVVAATKNIESRFRKILSENYSDLNMALNYALHRDQDYELIEAFVTAGADINFSDKIIICYYECLYREELSYKKCHKNKKEDSGGPLIIAVKEKCTKEIIQLLIESGANVNDVERHFHDGTSLPDTYSEWSPLPSAIHNISDENPDYEIMNILINAGANINFRYRSGQTPLFGKVIYSDNPDVISTLINYGIDVNVQDQEGNNVLMKAMGRSIKDKLPEIVRILLNAGINVNAKAADGNTALILAARENCQMEVIQALVEAGADINAQENNGETVLMWAARSHQSPELISFLVKSGADINAMDNNKATVTDYARRNPNPEVLKTVLSMSGQ